LDQNNSKISENRHYEARKDLKEWLDKAGLPYHSPHKFRHGFAVYAIKHAKNISDMKAISQNLMHANISITDGIYGGLSEMDIKSQITSLTSNSIIDEGYDLQELLRLYRENLDNLNTTNRDL